MRLTLAPLDADAARPDATAGPSEAGDEPAAEVVPLAPRRAARNVRTRTFAAVLSAAAVIVAVLGFVTVNKSQQLDRVESAMNDVTISQIATRAVSKSDLQVRLKGTAGSAQAVVEDTGHGYLLTDGMPNPGEGDVYQLWGKVDGTVLSLGTFGKGAEVVPFNVDPDRLDDIELFAVTQEKAPGVLASAQPALMVGTV